MLAGTNQDGGQRYNRRVVFDLVRRHGALSRTDIARRVGLSYQTVSNITDGLLADGLLVEARKKVGRRGQPPVELSVNPEGAFSLGFSFDSHGLRGVLVDLGGTPRAERETSLASTHPDAVLPAIAGMVRALADAGPAPAERMLGLGLGMPGLSRAGRLVTPASRTAHGWLADWADTPTIETLARLVEMPIYTDNDASAAAIGELVHGEGRRLSNFVYVFISDGIGAGLVFDRRPYRGAGGLAGEFGHLAVARDGPPCPCGRRGCLETYASLTAARRQVPGAGDGASLERLLAEGDPALAAWIGEAGRALAGAIVSVENLLDPEAVFVGGTVADPLLDALLAAMEPLPARIATEPVGGPRVRRARAGLASAALGAAALPIFAETASDLDMLFNGGRLRAAE